MMESDVLERPGDEQEELVASAVVQVKTQIGHAAGKTILILGASPDQLPLYQAAKAAGAYVIGADANPNSMARPFADRFLLLTSRSAEDIIIQLEGEVLDGVASPGNDSFHQTIYDLSQHYGLPNPPSSAAVAASCDKGYFSSRAEEMGIFAPAHCESKDPLVLLAFARGRALPLIVKPADSSGSKGLSFLEDLDQFPAAFDKASSTSPTGLVIIEDYVTGDQFGVEAFRLDGRCMLTATSKRGHTGPPDFLVTRHSVGFPLPAVLETDLVPAIDRIADALDITSGPLNFDLIVTPDGRICFIEMGARLSGNGFPALVRETYGVDTQDWVLRLALGIEIVKPDQFLRPRGYGIQQVLTAKETGRLSAVSGLEILRAHPACKQDTFFVKPGERVQQFKRTVDRLGVVLLAHEEKARVNEALSCLETSVAFVIDDDNLSPNLSPNLCGNQEY